MDYKLPGATVNKIEKQINLCNSVSGYGRIELLVQNGKVVLVKLSEVSEKTGEEILSGPKSLKVGG